MDKPTPPARTRLALPELFIAAGLLLFAGLVLWQTQEIPASSLYNKVGPTVFPTITAGGLGLLAVLVLVQALRGGWQPEEEKEVAADWKAVGFVAAGLLANVALIGPLGFTAASTLLFMLVTYGFGSRQPLRNGLIGFVLSLAAYFGFAKLLGVNIGAGVVENLLGG